MPDGDAGAEREGALRAYEEARDGRRVDAVLYSLIPTTSGPPAPGSSVRPWLPLG